MKSQDSPKQVLVIHGPNLNMLGKRQPAIYGTTSLDEINADLKRTAKTLGLMIETFQSNHEGEIVEKIQQAADTCNGIIINPAAYTHSSIAIRDALLLLKAPIIEIHLSNIDSREAFRRTSMIADIATARIAGFGPRGYVMALKAMAEMISS
ncbi:MAG: type II 3-dehydroquinate dehydratase [Deltaproteobacteria bacterium]|nr:type II 3-dehydroquinate dehydratase [Deltaproteobacteria bacterium]MBW1962627.1 type II 3-dehydroquinate dehydratase [Deltaproteobacteria bacterium]MBW1994175.1 type II 3-dehydroquinate dehydratase [Deltaproteobacteria bacterium]MBW2151911.1 type II 3-dehydroquinate dehydratase [Deltaproteobacteria bacterium]